MQPLSRERIEEILNNLALDWGVDEDASALLDILLESYSLDGAYTWLFFHNRNLGGTPLMLLEIGKHRLVFTEARALVAEGAGT